MHLSYQYISSVHPSIHPSTIDLRQMQTSLGRSVRTESEECARACSVKFAEELAMYYLVRGPLHSSGALIVKDSCSVLVVVLAATTYDDG